MKVINTVKWLGLTISGLLTIAALLIVLITLTGCGVKPPTLTASSNATPAPVVNCDADVNDEPLPPLPTPPGVYPPAHYVLQLEALQAAYAALYGYVSQALLPWAQDAAHVVARNHQLRQRTSACLGILRRNGVIH